MANRTFDRQRVGAAGTFGVQTHEASSSLHYTLPADLFTTGSTIAATGVKAALRFVVDGFSAQVQVQDATPTTQNVVAHYTLGAEPFDVIVDVYAQRLAQGGVGPIRPHGGRAALSPMVDGVAPVKSVFPSQYALTRIIATATDTTIVHPDYEVRIDGLARVKSAQLRTVRASTQRVRPTAVVNPTDEELLQLVLKVSQKGVGQNLR